MHPRVHVLFCMDNADNIKLSFGKNERLKSRATIESLFVQNRHLRIYPFKLVWGIDGCEKFEVKVGVSVSKKIFRTAVKRNFIKRRMRECYRLNKRLLYHRFPDKNISLAFMLIYVGNEIASYSDFNKKIKQLLIRLGDTVAHEIE